MMASIDHDPRCPWCLGFADYIRYHDEEWGLPSFDERHLFEMLILEGAQAGLSWATILKKRDHFRQAFDGFDARRMARYTPKKIERLMADPGIVRNRMKIEAAVGNARALLDLHDRGRSLADLLWRHVDGRPVVNHFRAPDEVPASTPLSAAVSRDLKGHGFRFVGQTISYALMQSVGMVNDHLVGCPRHAAVRR